MQLYDVPYWLQSPSLRNALVKIKEGPLLYSHPFIAFIWNYFHPFSPQTWFSPVTDNLFPFFVSFPFFFFFKPLPDPFDLVLGTVFQAIIQVLIFLSYTYSCLLRAIVLAHSLKQCATWGFSLSRSQGQSVANLLISNLAHLY